MKSILLLLTVLFSTSIYAKKSLNKALWDRDGINPTIQNTFIFWVNGDSDRFRPSSGIGSSNTRLDKVDVERIRELSKTCECNTIIFHDQRFSDKWYTSKKNYGAFVYAYSNGEEVSFYKSSKNRSVRNHLSFSEINQNQEFLVNYLKLAGDIFPDTKYHLIYRGHSFADSMTDRKRTFDMSHKETSFDLYALDSALEEAQMKFDSITFAACSMSNISFAIMLSRHAKYLISSQVNINETGNTGFNFDFLKSINDKLDAHTISHMIGSQLLKNFKHVEQRELFIRETPMTVSYLSNFAYLSIELEDFLSEIRNKIRAEPKKYLDAKIKIKASNRYLKSRADSGADEAQMKLISKFISVGSLNQDYDLGVLAKIEGRENLLRAIEGYSYIYDQSKASNKTGISLDLTY